MVLDTEDSASGRSTTVDPVQTASTSSGSVVAMNKRGIPLRGCIELRRLPLRLVWHGSITSGRRRVDIQDMDGDRM